MPVQVEDERIILYRHFCDYELLKIFVSDIKYNCNNIITEDEKQKIKIRLSKLGKYKTRNSKEKPNDAINHRINTLQYWMFGYKHKVGRELKFIFSPLGNLFLKHIDDDEKLKKIFVTMLFAVQFPHPGSTNMSSDFNIYLFRIIFKLLLDSRLEGKLYNQDYELCLAFLKNINATSYEELVSTILKNRNLADKDIIDILKSKEHTYVNNVYEWEYYTQNLLQSMGIINKTEGTTLCKLFHPTKKETTKPTSRTARRGFITLNSELISFIALLLENYHYDEMPLCLNDEERLEIDVIKEIYSFYPKELLNEIGDYNPIIDELLQLPKLIKLYAVNEQQGDCYNFEEKLAEGFNQFSNVDAVWRGGAGNTDVECIYTHEKRGKKFAVDGKSTANKLSSLNAGRLRAHRKKIGGKYTIVVTPKYVPAVKQDIYDEPIVIITSSTFSEYLYNCISHNVRDIDYTDFDEIIMNNLGTDVSKKISDLTLEKFGACA